MADDDTTPPADDTEDGQAPTEGESTGDGTGTSGDGAADAPKPGSKAYDEAYVRRLRDEAAKGRQAKTAAEQERDQAKARLDAVLKALDPDATGDEDPSEKAKNALTRAEQAEADALAARLDAAAGRAARRLDVDEDALMDSTRFRTALAKLDPTSDGFTDDLDAAINAAVGANAALKIAPKAPPASGTADLNGGAQGSGSSGPQSIDDRRDDRRKRRAT